MSRVVARREAHTGVSRVVPRREAHTGVSRVVPRREAHTGVSRLFQGFALQGASIFQGASIYSEGKHLLPVGQKAS